MTAPFGTTLTCPVQPAATAVSLNTVAFIAPRAGTVSAVNYTTVTADTRAVTLVNKGQAGAGAVTVATLQFDSGVNTVAADEKTITLSGTPANLVVAAGDVLQWQSAAIGTGLADPGGLAAVTIAANYA